MYQPAEDRLGVISDDAGRPLVVGLESAIATDRARVGDATALLARLRGFGLPVPDGFAVTADGVALLAAPASDTGLEILRRAWSTVRGPLLLRLAPCCGGLGNPGGGPQPVEGDTWGDMLEGLCRVLRQDLRDNPVSPRRAWSIAVLKRPVAMRPALVMNGDPFDRGAAVTIVASGEGAHGSLDRRRHTRLTVLAAEASARLGRPVDLEILLDDDGMEWIVDCLPYEKPFWSRAPHAEPPG